jgi:prolyl oligopeptidase
MKKLYIIFVICFSAYASFAQYKYPATKTVDSTHTYFGTTYKDPYEWLENFKDTTVVTWFKQQANYTNSILNKIKGRDGLIAEWKMLDQLQPAHIKGTVYENGRVFYKKTMSGEKVGKLYYREGVNGPEQLLFDPTTYIAGKTLTIEKFIPSFDAKQIAIGYSSGGAELSTIKIINVDTKQFVKDEMPQTAGLEGWTFDNKAILYIWLKSNDNTDPLARLNPKTKLHIIGTADSTDVDFFSNSRYPDLHISGKVYPFVQLTDDNKDYVFSGEGSVQNEMVMYYAPIDQLNSAKIQWKTLCKADDKLVRGMEFIGDSVFAITYNGAKNYKLVATDLKNPDWTKARTVSAEKPNQTLEDITHCKDYLIMTYSDGINSQVYKYEFATGKVTELTLPFIGTAMVSCLNNKTNICTVDLTSWVKPNTEFDFDAATGVFTPGVFNKPPAYPAAYNDLEVKEVEVKGHDGVMIPLSIMYRKGTKLDGNNACLMDAYGAYGISIPSSFWTIEATLVVKGAVVAIPHVRGGSEKGEAWYKAGYKTTKPNTWKDFISCGEYLIANGYTKSSKLAGMGTSAGGILISRSITERPDLFAAAICNVGCANAMRLEFTSNGPVNIPEFGTVKDSVECKALYEMDGVQHVVAGTKYPAVICVGGWNDPRVVAWQPGKFAAALQNATTSGKPVLMKVNYDDGHFTEDKSVTWANFADQFAFVMWQCGHPDFQLKK